MPQALLPIFQSEMTPINETIGFQKKEGQVYYFQGIMPFFTHDENDLASFRFIAAQIAVLGNASQAEIVRAFGISTICMKRYVKRYRECGPASFFLPPKRRGAGVLTPEVLPEIQKDLDQGKTPSQIAEERDLKADTLKKAIRAGRLRQPEKKTSKPQPRRSAP